MNVSIRNVKQSRRYLRVVLVSLILANVNINMPKVVNAESSKIWVGVSYPDAMYVNETNSIAITIRNRA